MAEDDISNKYSFSTLIQQRRFWIAVLSCVGIVAIQFNLPWLSEVSAVVAGALGVDSYVRPKQ